MRGAWGEELIIKTSMRDLAVIVVSGKQIQRLVVQIPVSTKKEMKPANN